MLLSNLTLLNLFLPTEGLYKHHTTGPPHFISSPFSPHFGRHTTITPPHQESTKGKSSVVDTRFWRDGNKGIKRSIAEGKTLALIDAIVDGDTTVVSLVGMVVRGAIVVGFPRTTINSLRIFFRTKSLVINARFTEHLCSSSWNHLTGLILFSGDSRDCQLQAHRELAHCCEVLEEDDDEKLNLTV
ncbi:hypothetical protein L2E82_25910 [Cichorium intybus]|uniref:Uncharacterized protein n=1 Tax=Cichorium intybus TaxID=13427 RepID=A0ACB9E535_CICIN|nr:hypothetical protein L2E82_25910 [Cichorium intybus]